MLPVISVKSIDSISNISLFNAALIALLNAFRNRLYTTLAFVWLILISFYDFTIGINKKGEKNRNLNRTQLPDFEIHFFDVGLIAGVERDFYLDTELLRCGVALARVLGSVN